MSEDKLKHLEFIQNIITRMNTNSFQIKEWTIAIVSALLALYASTNNISFVLLGIFPTFLFWFLDSYYLMQERKFRGLYNDVACVSKDLIEIKVFNMNLDSYKKGKYSYFNVFRTCTIWPMYLFIIVLLSIIFFKIF